MYYVYEVITNCGDGSNSIEYCVDPKVVDAKQILADAGDETYASGDGLQVFKLAFKTLEARDEFVELNCPYIHTMENRGDEWDYRSV
jgi:hypothetical protein